MVSLHFLAQFYFIYHSGIPVSLPHVHPAYVSGLCYKQGHGDLTLEAVPYVLNRLCMTAVLENEWQLLTHILSHKTLEL